MTFAKVKIEGIGKFKCKNYAEFNLLTEDIKLKVEGIKVKRLEK